jgi:hypothetical protein
MTINFEDIHKKFDGTLLDICKECGGRCEKEAITVFLPGEAEFVAKKMCLSLKKFVDKFCNIIKFYGHTIYTPKVGMCPLLDKKYNCILAKLNCKLIRCSLYPILMDLSKNKIRIFVDFKDCPMSHKINDAFKNQAFKIYEEIKDQIPRWWLEFVSKYDERIYDYKKLEKLRNKKVISLKELRTCVIK